MGRRNQPTHVNDPGETYASASQKQFFCEVEKLIEVPKTQKKLVATEPNRPDFQ